MEKAALGTEEAVVGMVVTVDHTAEDMTGKSNCWGEGQSYFAAVGSWEILNRPS